MATRIYVVTSAHAGNRLIRAATPAQAVRHAARGVFHASVATQDDLVAHLPSVEVEDATAAEDEQE